MPKESMLGSALAEVVGPLKDFAEKLGGEEGTKWLAAFKRFLRKENPWPTAPEFKIWKTIKLGTGIKTAGDFQKALESNGCRVSDWAEDILGNPAFTSAAEEIEVDLVKVTVGELGFKDGARRDQIYDRVRELGLEICPPEVGPQLRLQYKDQPKGEWILVGMEPIADSGDGLLVFRVGRHDSELWLGVYRDDPGGVWLSGSQWVFVRPRK